MRARDIKWMVFLCITILLLGLLSGCSSFNNIIKEEQDDKKATTSEKIPVEVVAARIGNIQVVREFAGKLRPVKDIMIIPKIPGKVTKIHVKIGQEVKQGDILIELDGTDVDYQVAQAQSAYDASKASVELSKQNLRELKARNKELEDEVRTLNQRIEEVKKTLSETEQAISPEVAKLLKQLREGKITQEEYDAFKAKLEGKLKSLGEQQQALIAQRTMLETEEKTIESTLKSMPYDDKTLDAQLKQARTILETAKGATDSLKLCSPIDGVIGSLTVEEGEMVAQTLSPANVLDMSSMLLDIQLSEFDVSRAKPGQKLKVYIEAADSQPIEGVVDWVSPSPDPRIQAYLASIKLDNSSGKLRPGMFARASLVLDSSKNVMMIPKRSLIRENDTYYVFVVDGNVAEKRQVKIGLDDGDEVEIVSGLKKGEPVVIKGQTYLKQGQKVNIVQEETI